MRRLISTVSYSTRIVRHSTTETAVQVASAPAVTVPLHCISGGGLERINNEKDRFLLFHIRRE